MNLVIVGADRVAANGDVANKIGTYGLAVLAGTTGFPSMWLFPGAPSISTAADGSGDPHRGAGSVGGRRIAGTEIGPPGRHGLESGFRRDPGPSGHGFRHRWRGPEASLSDGHRRPPGCRLGSSPG